MSKLIQEKETYAILGACFEVYKDKGHGFLESVYQECLEIEFQHQGILFTPQVTLPLVYKGVQLRQGYKGDFVCFENTMLEIKAVSCLLDEHRSQLLNYLNAGRCPVGMLVNFGHYPRLEHERFALTH